MQANRDVPGFELFFIDYAKPWLLSSLQSVILYVAEQARPELFPSDEGELVANLSFKDGKSEGIELYNERLLNIAEGLTKEV